MTSRSLPDILALVASDLRHNRGRRTLHAVAWRLRRVRNRYAPWLKRRAHDSGLRAYTVAFGDNGEEVLRRLRDHLPAYGVGFMLGGEARSTVRTIHIDAADIESLCRCVLDLCGDFEIEVRVPRRLRRPLSQQIVPTLAGGRSSFDLLVVERTTSLTSALDGPQPRTHKARSRIQVAAWQRHGGPHESTYWESDRSFPVVARLRDDTFARLRTQRHDFGDDLAPAEVPPFEVDVVYTWVDDQDETWQAAKDRCAAELGRKPSGVRALREERFRNRDELKYSLRSLALFAPWVRKIHIVTANQTPSWLNVDHPKINMVSHEDIYADPDWLPTFNSSGIESQLHHIPDLAQKFVYFNDDFFLGQLTDPVDFFHGNGVIKFFPSSQRAYEGDIDERSEEYIQADKNVIELLSREYPSVGRAIMRHVPYPADRDLLYELEQKYSEHFAACASSRFRSSRDIRPIAFMQYHYGYHHQRAIAGTITHRYLALWKDTIIDQMAAVERRRSYKTFCINDVGLQPERAAQVNQAVVDFLEAYFPEPSEFELT